MEISPGEGGPSQQTGWYVGNAWAQSWNPSQCQSFTGKCVAFPLSDTTTPKGVHSLSRCRHPVPGGAEDPAIRLQRLESHRLGRYGGAPSRSLCSDVELEVQRELPANLMITVGYTGTHGTHLQAIISGARTMFRPPRSKNCKNRTSGPPPSRTTIQDKLRQALAQLYGTSTLPLNLLLAPYPFWGGINPTFTLDGESVYNALNVKVQKRLSHGLNYGVAYTNSKMIDNCCVAQMLSNVLDSHSRRGGAIFGRGDASSRQH